MNHKNNNIYQGVVFWKSNGHYKVNSEGREYDCSLSKSVFKSLNYSNDRRCVYGKKSKHAEKETKANALAAGDVVRFIEQPDGKGKVIEVLPRKNAVTRRAASPMPGAYSGEQTIAANVDLLVPVFAAAMPSPKWGLLDRYLILAESLQLPSLMVISKADMLSSNPDRMMEIQEITEIYRRIGYQVFQVSTKTGEGMRELENALQGNVCVLLGKSGVGKSSLINALLPDLHLRVNDISRSTCKGKHTTSQVEMYPMRCGGAVMDTPGSREFGLWDLDRHHLEQYFPEMRQYSGKCRYGLDCQHLEEPGCVLRKAVTEGHISALRYRNYVRLKTEGDY